MIHPFIIVLVQIEKPVKNVRNRCGIRWKMMDIPKGTCCGQYFGGEILQDAFGKVFDGTGDEFDHNIYAFDQKIDPVELRKLKAKKDRMSMQRMRKCSNGNYENNGVIKANEVEEEIPSKIFVIDPFIGDWKSDELILRFVNDCRADIDDKVPSEEDERYYNVEYVGMKVNGWPQTYLVTKRDIKQGEELMTYYGVMFSDAITRKLEEEEKKRKRKERVDRTILKGIQL